jgi:hypothetical protein
MPIKTRRYRKRNNKSRRTRKNKTRRRYKKQMKGGNGLIQNEDELQKSWENKSLKSWLVNDGVGTMTEIYREDAARNEKMPYGLNTDTLLTDPPTFRGKINYYLKLVVADKPGAYIKVVYK